jgi:hypothetical protein
MKKLAYNKRLLIVIIGSLLIKFALFSYAAINVPSAKFMPDTITYVKPGVNLIEKGVFATFDANGNIKYEINRTPGYPLFIGLLNKVVKLSFDAIIFVQILLITLAGFIIYKAAYELDTKIALLAAFIFLFDQPTTLSALMVLTEAVYTVFIALFVYLFLNYLKGHKITTLIFSVLTLAIATFIRPVSYYLGVCLAAGISYVLFKTDIKKAILHALILLLIFYSTLGLWNYRNYLRSGRADFTTIDNTDLRHMGLTHKYTRTHDLKEKSKGPFLFYVNHTSRSIVQFFTLPGTFKYFKSKSLRIVSKIFGYPWVAFWLIGLLFAPYDRLAYRFLLITILYFMLASVVVTGLCVGSRFRVPIMPLISILSAGGWLRIAALFGNIFRTDKLNTTKGNS